MPLLIFDAVADRRRPVTLMRGSIYVVRIVGTPYTNVAGPAFRIGPGVMPQISGFSAFYIHRSGTTPTSLQVQLITESQRHFEATGSFADIGGVSIGTTVGRGGATFPGSTHNFLSYSYFFFWANIGGGDATTTYELQLTVK